jgi:GNAT superfamily N-acetyltransferase
MNHLEQLSNNVWTALHTKQEQLAIHYDGVSFYHPDYAAFGAWQIGGNIANALDQYLQLVDSCFLVGEELPQMPKGFKIEKVVRCYQMILEDMEPYVDDADIVLLQEDQYDDIRLLMSRAMPAYFRPKTPYMGHYYGIYSEDRLMAITGERISIPGYTELSAVATDPDFLGRGLAQRLVKFASSAIWLRGEIPYLHVQDLNIKPVYIYEKLGYKTSQITNFTLVTRST